jgi:hypothetical protein
MFSDNCVKRSVSAATPGATQDIQRIHQVHRIPQRSQVKVVGNKSRSLAFGLGSLIESKSSFWNIKDRKPKTKDQN